MARCEHLKDKDGSYSGCYDCKYHSDRLYSDIFGECPICEHEPNPENLFEIREFEEPCPYFDYKVFFPQYKDVVMWEKEQQRMKLKNILKNE